MAGEVLIDKAVRDLAAHVEANLAAELRQVETDQGLPANTLGKWSRIVRAWVPTTSGGGSGAPEIQIYDEPTEVPSQRHDLIAVNCAVDMVWSSPSNQPEAAEDFGRRWMTALYRCIAGKHPQSSNTGEAFLVRGFDRKSETYESTTRHARSVEVEVRVHSPRP